MLSKIDLEVIVEESQNSEMYDTSVQEDSDEDDDD